MKKEGEKMAKPLISLVFASLDLGSAQERCGQKRMRGMTGVNGTAYKTVRVTSSPLPAFRMSRALPR